MQYDSHYQLQKEWIKLYSGSHRIFFVEENLVLCRRKGDVGCSSQGYGWPALVCTIHIRMHSNFGDCIIIIITMIYVIFNVSSNIINTTIIIIIKSTNLNKDKVER